MSQQINDDLNDQANITSCYTKSELADFYNVHVNTFIKRLKTIGIKTGRRKVLWPKEVTLIVQELGNPGIS